MTKPTYLNINVYEAALDRVRYVYNECDDVIVAMSGGKDSTVLLHLARVVAKERGIPKIKVVWLDQEVEWQATSSYMKTIMYALDVRPFWFQFPFRLTNSLSHAEGFLTVWDPAVPHLWIREKDPISIKVNPCKRDRFTYLGKHMHARCGVAGKKHVGVLVGLRMVESPKRRLQFTKSGASYKNIKWCHKHMIENTRTFWPIYDFQDQDVWVCIARNDLSYNRVYDDYFRYGITRHDMRVSSLIHETSYRWIGILQEVEPWTYDRFIRRVPGVSTFGHMIDDITPKTLPAAFSSWREYRDYLLKHIIKPQNRPIFLKLWKGDTSEEACKQQVRGLVINDIESAKFSMAKVVSDQKDFA